jgi:hypothetical protein
LTSCIHLIRVELRKGGEGEGEGEDDDGGEHE